MVNATQPLIRNAAEAYAICFDGQPALLGKEFQLTGVEEGPRALAVHRDEGLK